MRGARRPGGRGRTAVRALAVGAGFVALYVGGAMLSGAINPLARRPILDGLAPPPPYRWVSPPPALASSNKPPSSGTANLSLNPQTGSEPAVLNTSDLQVSLVVAGGAFGPAAGQDSVQVKVSPLAPTGFGRSPAGQTIVGNVYKIVATYRPGGEAPQRMRVDAQLTLVYPSAANVLGTDHTVLYSADGKEWLPAASFDSRIQQQVQANVGGLGYYAVGASPKAAGSGGGNTARTIATVAIVVLAAAVGLFLIVGRRRRGAGPAGQGRR